MNPVANIKIEATSSPFRDIREQTQSFPKNVAIPNFSKNRAAKQRSKNVAEVNARDIDFEKIDISQESKLSLFKNEASSSESTNFRDSATPQGLRLASSSFDKVIDNIVGSSSDSTKNLVLADFSGDEFLI